MMKKSLLVFLILIGFVNVSFASNCSIYPDCENYCDKKEKYRDLRLDSIYSDSNRDYYYDTYQENSDKYYECKDEEYEKYESNFDKGVSAYKYGSYKSAVEYFEVALEILPTCEGSKSYLASSYYGLAFGSFEKANYQDAINYYRKAEINGFGDKYLIYFNTGVSYYLLGDIEEALEYYNDALDETFDTERIEDVKERIALVEFIEEENKQIKEAKENAPSNDIYSYKQSYIHDLNIQVAQKSFSTNQEVIVAIIDDGININHPDLTENIWVNKSEIPGNKIDDDNNGYIDDYNGWNYIYNSNNLLPLGSHGTMIAGIIGAESNNNEGVMGIIKNVKMMPIGVCDNEGCEVDNIIKGIKYAVDNGANIINLSLGGSQFFGYNISYDEALEYAYSKGVIVVIAAGNGDILSSKEEGVNTSVNKISPVCNFGDSYKNIIGVGAFTEDGYRTRWSNYGDCISFYAPGVNIFSTSIFEENQTITNYGYGDGTSFSAPMITGIIGLGYNRYGKIDNDIVWDALYYSLVKNEVGNYIVDANEYLTYLKSYIENKELSDKANLVLLTFDKALKKYSETKKLAKYKEYADLINSYIPKLSEGTKKELLILIVNGLNERAGNNRDDELGDLLEDLLGE